MLQDQQKSVISMERVEKEKHILSRELKQQTQVTKEKEALLDKVSMHIIKCM